MITSKAPLQFVGRNGTCGRSCSFSISFQRIECLSVAVPGPAIEASFRAAMIHRTFSEDVPDLWWRCYSCEISSRLQCFAQPQRQKSRAG